MAIKKTHFTLIFIHFKNPFKQTENITVCSKCSLTNEFNQFLTSFILRDKMHSIFIFPSSFTIKTYQTTNRQHKIQNIKKGSAKITLK